VGTFTHHDLSKQNRQTAVQINQIY